MKTITIYELLGMIKDGKAPKKIKYDGIIWEYTGYQYERIDKENLGNIWNGYNFNILNDEVEIIEEEKKIPEKLNIEDDGNTIMLFGEKENEWTILDNVDVIVCNKINYIIEYLETKEKGE